MKAVIADIDGKCAIALNKKGEFIKIKNNGSYKIGSEVEIQSTVSFNPTFTSRMISVAAMFLFITGLSYGIYSYNSPYSYIDVDINPSIEITANVFDRIIKIEGLNKDGERIISLNSFNNKDIKDGINSILQSAVQEGYLAKSTGNTVMLTVSGKNEKKVEKIQNEVRVSALKEVEKKKVDTEVLVQNLPVEKHDEARKAGISPGKAHLIEEAVKADPELKAEDLKNEPVRNIMKSIKESKKKSKASGSEANKNGKAEQKDGTRGQDRGKKDSDSAKSGDQKPKDSNDEKKDNSKGNSQKRKEIDNEDKGSGEKDSNLRESFQNKFKQVVFS